MTLSNSQIREIRKRHVPQDGDPRGQLCVYCSMDLIAAWWPCDAALLLAELDRRNKAELEPEPGEFEIEDKAW